MANALRHLAIIMDGNGRWSAERGTSKAAGYQAGAASLARIMGAIKAHGIETLSVFAFSSENWERSASEVRTLLGLFASSLEQYSQTFLDQGIALRVVGRRDRFGDALVRQIEDIERRTSGGANTLIVAADYGGRWDIASAARHLARRIATGAMSADELDEAALGDALSTAGVPDPDLLIRTGAEQRISNFMLWQTAYTELFFADCWWPDFDEQWLERAICDYKSRQRRFGRNSCK